MSNKKLNGANAQVNGVKNAEKQVMNTSNSQANASEKVELTAEEKALKKALQERDRITREIVKGVKDEEMEIKSHLRVLARKAARTKFGDILEENFGRLSSEIYKQGDYVVITTKSKDDAGNEVTKTIKKCVVWKPLFRKDGSHATVHPISGVTAYKAQDGSEVAVNNFTETYSLRTYTKAIWKEGIDAETQLPYKVKIREEKIEKKYFPCVQECISLADFCARFAKAMQIVFPEGIK